MLLTHDASYLKIGPATVPGSVATIPEKKAGLISLDGTTGSPLRGYEKGSYRLSHRLERLAPSRVMNQSCYLLEASKMPLSV